MTPTEVASAIAGAGFVLSLLMSATGVGIAYATLRAKVAALEQGTATKADVQGLSLQLAEIKGQLNELRATYRLVPVNPPATVHPSGD